MTGREKLLRAFDKDGTPEIGVAASYEGIFIRDHYAALTRVPWWDGEKAHLLAKDFHQASGLEWFAVAACASRNERARQRHEQRTDGVWLIDQETGREIRLQEPTPSGVNSTCSGSRHADIDALPSTEDEIDALIPLAPVFDRKGFVADGRHDAAVAVRAEVDILLYSHAHSPLWSLYGMLGYEGMMIFNIVKAVGKRCVVFGNLDAIGVLQNGSEDMLRAEIIRQLKAGRDNGNRFVMSTGSPITPETSVDKVRRYTDMARELA